MYLKISEIEKRVTSDKKFARFVRDDVYLQICMANIS